jgi:hypothetical protein
LRWNEKKLNKQFLYPQKIIIIIIVFGAVLGWMLCRADFLGDAVRQDFRSS